jgi:nucleoside-triphosphatase
MTPLKGRVHTGDKVSAAMRMTTKNLFLTGKPGIGKTTVIQKTIEKLSVPVTGFHTGEIREGPQRVGFSIVTLDGKQGILAHVRLKGKFKVGRYTVNLEDIERVAVPAMTPKSPAEVVVIDEVGKMECFSEAFRRSLVSALDGPNTVLGTIAVRGTSFIESVKSRADMTILEVNFGNRNELPEKLASMLL